MNPTLTSPDLYVEHLKDMDNMETQNTQALPQINTTVELSAFKIMLEYNRKQTAEHIARLEQIWSHSP
jgi:ferritin-like metal-binding protein YciE